MKLPSEKNKPEKTEKELFQQIEKAVAEYSTEVLGIKGNIESLSKLVVTTDAQTQSSLDRMINILLALHALMDGKKKFRLDVKRDNNEFIKTIYATQID